MLFNEPAQPREACLGLDEPAVHYFTESTRPDAIVAREAVNAWYSTFPDADGSFAERLRSEVDVDHAQALDELFVYQVLVSRHQDVRYEEGGVGPDFRIYHEGRCIGAVEVASLFLRQDWNDPAQRHNRLADAVNERVPPTDGYFVAFDIEDAPTEPAPRHFSDFVKRELGKLPPHEELAGISYDDLPTANYERNGVRITVRFLPMKAGAASKSNPDARIVGIGPMTVGFVNSGVRLKDVVGKKGGDRYELGGVPYIVVVGIHDTFCSEDVVIDGLYGGEAIRVDRNDLSVSEVVRRNDGLFGADSARPSGRHRRISAVGILRGGPLWEPERVDLAVYDNPYAATPAPKSLLAATRWFGALNPDADRSDFGWVPID